MAANTARDLLHDILGPIRPLLARDDVTDLCINGPGLLFVEGARGWERLQADNLTNTWLQYNWILSFWTSKAFFTFGK